MLEASVPFQVNLLPVIISPSRWLLLLSGLSSPACNMYPLLFTEVIELFRYVNTVGVLLGIFTPVQFPVEVSFTTVPSNVSVPCPNKIQELMAKQKMISIFKVCKLFLFLRWVSSFIAGLIDKK